MILSTRGHYGLRAMTRLAQAHGQGPLSLAEIAANEGLSPSYLEQLVAPLRKAGLVEATRGAHGGYRLAKDPAQITVGEVIRVLEGPIGIVECASELQSPGCCEREPTCASKPLWQRVRANIAEMLDSTTLADLWAGERIAEPLELAAEASQPRRKRRRGAAGERAVVNDGGSVCTS